MTTDDLERALRELHDDNCMNRMWSPCPLTDEWADCTQLEALRSAAALGAQHRQEQIVAMMRRTAATVLERATSPDDSEKRSAAGALMIMADDIETLHANLEPVGKSGAADEGINRARVALNPNGDEP